MSKRTDKGSRRAATTTGGRGVVNTSPLGRVVRRTTGPVREEEVLAGVDAEAQAVGRDLAELAVTEVQRGALKRF